MSQSIERVGRSLAARTTRRSFLGKVGKGLLALVGGPFVGVALQASRADAYHICGHIYTTGSCPHPYHPHTRIDRYGYPVHPVYGYPVDDDGDIYTSKRQRRRKICEQIVPERYPFTRPTVLQGTWSRCCDHRVRRVVDCCSYADTRINGDAALTGYCYQGRKVFCITYIDTTVRC